MDTLGLSARASNLCRRICFLFLTLIILTPAFSSHLPQTLKYSDLDNEISANPGATNLTTGTGALGHALHIPADSGLRLGGLWIADGNAILTGGAESKKLSGNNLAVIGLSFDTEKSGLWPGGLFAANFLQFNGMNSNAIAGSIQGFNGLPAAAPFHRSELYQLWYRQSFSDNKLILRIGKSLPIDDFDNVLRSVPTTDKSLAVPSVSGLIYTPIFVNPTTIGVMPGYYNSAYGITVTAAPTKDVYLSLGAYDGSLASGRQTGIKVGPSFDGYYFYIGELGTAWTLGSEDKPGIIAIGAWDQTGKLQIPGLVNENGAQGLYSFGSQRLWLHHPGVDNSGISAFFQLGINDSKTLPMDKYIGLGLTAFALTRPKDSFGIGLALAHLNQREFDRSSELMLQSYYQLHLISSAFLNGSLSYIPTPGASKNQPETWAVTLRLITLF